LVLAVAIAAYVGIGFGAGFWVMRALPTIAGELTAGFLVLIPSIFLAMALHQAFVTPKRADAAGGSHDDNRLSSGGWA